MSEIFYAVALLACPVGMGAMMWFMMRGKQQQPAIASTEDTELTQMREEIDQLRAAQQSVTAPGR